MNDKAIKKEVAEVKKTCAKDEEPCVVIRASNPTRYSITKIKK